MSEAVSTQSLVFGGFAFASVVNLEPSLFFGGVCLGIVSIPIGAALGYLAGVLIAGVFLVIDRLGQRRVAFRSAKAAPLSRSERRLSRYFRGAKGDYTARTFAERKATIRKHNHGE